jgi:hydroxyacylglutathione hydrolase
MLIETFVLTPFQQNTRVVACKRTRKAVCIDPGERSEELVSFIRDNDLDLQAITLTHGHLDHVGGTSDLKAAFPAAEVLLHADDESLYYALPKQPLFFGLAPEQLDAMGMAYDPPPTITRNWVDGEEYAVGDLLFSVRHCPGHTPGHVILAELTQAKVFVGDCLFQNSIGRTDLPGGSHEQLMDSIEKNILSLGDDHTVYSGHGPETTVGQERSMNPFLNGTYQMTKGRFF